MNRHDESPRPIEALESRTLLASADVLVVRCTDLADQVTISQRTGDGGIPLLRVIVNAQVRNFDLTGIKLIVIETIGGNDIVTISSDTKVGINVNGGLGDDSIIGGGGNDSLIGGRGRDTLVGKDGNDYLKGYGDEDLLLGDNGQDTLEGGDGDDNLQGGNDNDRLLGGRGHDQMYGQGGNDFFESKDGEVDTVVGGGGSANRARSDIIDFLVGIQIDVA